MIQVVLKNGKYVIYSTKGGVSIPPANSVAPVISGSTSLGSTLSCTTGTWTGIPAPTFTYQWYRGASLISGATNSTYVTVLADSTASITCRVTGTNTAGSAVAISNSLTMDNYTPVNSVAPVISGTTTLGSTLTSTTGTWSNNPATYSYQWYRGASLIGGATSNTYVTVVGDSLANITCVVTATNIAGFASSTSNTLTMANYTPANTVAPAVSGTAVVGQVLTTTNGTWTNSPSSYSYQWKRGATNIGTNASTYTLLQADAGNTSNITCVVTATNSAGSANATSNTVAQILDATWYAMQTTLSISDSTTIDAMNRFTISRKTALATSSVTEYPMIGGTATTVVRNLYNPADTNAAKRMTISGTVTCNSNGITGNGTNGYLNMYVNDITDLSNDFTFYWYSRTNEDRNDFIYGAVSSTFIGITHQIKVGGNTYYYARTGQTNGGALARTDGFFLCKLSGNTFTLKRNNVQIYSVTVTQQAKQNLDMYFSAVNRGGGLTGYSQKNFSHFSVLNVATTTQQDTDLYNAVLAKETALGRNV